ncbi:MAG: U32 family peptidase, partial [Clostridia bacterium]|nr:U32 family peptidase [Clostridia bacterium]
MKGELLAPAGNLDCLKIAVKSGADAVYLGLNDFNARNNISNFSREDLIEGVKFAHLFGVKVYLTLNILIKDEEIANVLDFVRFALSAKVDAFIIQDVGIASLLNQAFPKIELHASTQMGISTLEGAKFLK